MTQSIRVEREWWQDQEIDVCYLKLKTWRDECCCQGHYNFFHSIWGLAHRKVWPLSGWVCPWHLSQSRNSLTRCADIILYPVITINLHKSTCGKFNVIASWKFPFTFQHPSCWWLNFFYMSSSTRYNKIFCLSQTLSLCLSRSLSVSISLFFYRI